MDFDDLQTLLLVSSHFGGETEFKKRKRLAEYTKSILTIILESQEFQEANRTILARY